MAQDFGDEAGESLRRSISRAVGMFIRDWLREREYQRRMAERDTTQTTDKSDALSDPAIEQTQPEEVYLNFGEAAEAQRFASLCQDEGIDVMPLMDADGRGYIRFAPGDLEKVQAVAPQFAELMTRLQIERVSKTLEAEPITPAKVKELTEVRGQTLPSHDAPTRETPERADMDRHTDRIAAEVRAARSQCRTLDELERSLAAKGIGITVSKDGEVMFYEPRLDENGAFLPYSHEQRDWAVGARVLKDRYGIDATHDSFLRDDPTAREQPNQPEPQVADGSLDNDGRTPDLNQEIESHDGMDTDVSTLRLEREQNGTDVAPSEVRKESARSREDDLSLDSVAKECRAASKQLERESGISDRELDLSDKLNPVR